MRSALSIQTSSGRGNPRFRPRFALVACLIALAVTTACGDDDAGDVAEDSGSTGNPLPDAGDGGPDGSDNDVDGGAEPCDDDDDCADEDLCNGVERCLDRRCETLPPPHCSHDHQCLKDTGKCDCTIPDLDKDGVDATECLTGGNDCNDHDPQIYEGHAESCHPGSEDEDEDEDCNPNTFQDDEKQDGDRDQDGVVSDRCVNWDANGHRHGGTDCNDGDDTAFPGHEEVCDIVDNNCNGIVDEGSRDGGPVEPHGLQERFYPDRDHDMSGDKYADPIMGCDLRPPAGTLPEYLAYDCDDDNIDINSDAVELCDGRDNDCDDFTDSDDQNEQPLLENYHFDGAKVACVGKPDGDDDDSFDEAEWWITDCPDGWWWCSGVAAGCSTNVTTIDNCGDCDIKCSFSCGGAACDEVESLALGEDHSCAITGDGLVACWGRAAEGRLGYDSVRNSGTPSAVVGGTNAKMIAAGANNACAVIGERDELFCWGSSEKGQLANFEFDDSFSSAAVPVGGYYDIVMADVESVSVASLNICATAHTGELFCWGTEADGRIGIGSADEESWWNIPRLTIRDSGADVTDAKLVALGERHGCITSFDGTVSCWGDNEVGQLGDAAYTEPNSSTVRRVPGLSDVTALAAGWAHTCVVTAGQVLCWGSNGDLQLGRESGPNNGVPQVVDGLEHIKEVGAGMGFTCARDERGRVYCWGSNTQGQRGDSDPETTAVPTLVLDDADSLAVGAAHACAVSGAQVVCWGNNVYGQLGLGADRESHSEPSSIKPLDRID